VSRRGTGSSSIPSAFKLGRGPELYRRATDLPSARTSPQSEEICTGWLLAKNLLELLRTKGGLQAEPVAVDAETRKALEALGYL
jgi:hypothetical protein